MKMSSITMLALLLISVVPAVSLAASITPSASQSSLISQYVPIGVIANATFYSQSIGTGHYIIMQLGGQYKYVVFNFTNPSKPTILLNTSQIQVPLTTFLNSQFYPSNAVIGSLSGLMNEYINSTQSEFNDCMDLTGLSNPVGGCTYANNCASCMTVPACNYVLEQSGGTSYPFAVGIMNFSENYTQLNDSYMSYFTAANGINQSNIYSKVSTLYSSAQNIAAEAIAIQQNPIFPLPANFSLATLQSCVYTSTPLGQPWYCTVANGGSGYCDQITYNWTAYNKLNQTLINLHTLPVTGYSPYAEALNSSTLAHSFLSVFSTQQQNQSFGTYLKAIAPQYNAIVSNVIALTNKTTNSSLTLSLNNLESVYASIRQSGASLNLTYANKTITSAMVNTTMIYARVKALYQPVYNLAQNNTAKITVEQLNYPVVPVSLATLATQQQQINEKLNGVVNATQLPIMLKQLQAISSQLSLSGPVLDMPSLVKAIDGGIVSGILSGGSGSIASKNGSAPAYSAIISLVIGIVVIGIVYMLTYHRLKRRQRLQMHQGVKKAWDMLFVALFILVIIYAVATYSYASSANQFLPVSDFLGAVHGSAQVYITYNTSAANTTASLACVKAIKSDLVSQNKSVTTITVSGISCLASSNPNLAGTDCYNNVLSSMKPVIQIDSNTNSSISYYGMYGTALHTSGSAASGPTCPLSAIFSAK